MEKNPSLQILVPFIVNRIEREYDVPEPKGFAKKNLYLMVINSLNNNRWINLEFHVGLAQQKHIILKILVYLLTSNRVSTDQDRDGELLLRENCAKLLARIADW